MPDWNQAQRRNEPCNCEHPAIYFTRSRTVVQIGQYAGRHRASDKASYTIGQTVAKLRASQAYVFSGYVQIPSTNDRFTFRARVRWRNASNMLLRTDTFKTYLTDTQGRWDRVWARMVAPAGTTNARIQMVVRSLNATIDVDSFAFRLAPTTAAESPTSADEAAAVPAEAEPETADDLPLEPDGADDLPLEPAAPADANQE